MKRVWLIGIVVAVVAGAGVVLALQLTRSTDAESHLRDVLNAQAAETAFPLTTATVFAWDTLHVYGLGLTPLTGEPDSLTRQIPETIRETLRHSSEDWVLAFFREGKLVIAIPVNGEEPLPALRTPRESGFSADILWLKIRCPGLWTGQQFALVTARTQDGPPSSCPTHL